MRSFIEQTFELTRLKRLGCGAMIALSLLSSGCQLPDYYRPGGYSSSYQRLQELPPTEFAVSSSAASSTNVEDRVIRVP